MLRFLQGHAFAIIVLSLLLLTSRGDLRLTAIQQAVAPYNYDLVTWEASHFMGKWWYRAWDVLPGGHRDREGRLASIRRFFDLVAQVNGQAAAVQRVASAPAHAEGELAEAEARLDELRARLRAEGARVEEALESELSNALGAQGLVSRIGMVFPPVDFAFDPTPRLLIVSPRDRIETRATALLRSDMTVEQMEGVEVQILRSEDLSALVDDTGGVATYPSVIPPAYDLRTTLQIIAHEWLHQFFFFRPLGRHYNSTPEMSTLNETAADMAGRELGDLAYEAITGQKPEPPGPPSPPGVFDFSREMRITRVHTDELLAQGRIEDAERYMEERRKVFVQNGYYIRKLNQAYFAFHGAYAESAASVSPIAGELQRMRQESGSVGEFIRRVARLGSYEAFKAELGVASPEATSQNHQPQLTLEHN